MSDARITKQPDGTVKAVCAECNKNVSVAVIGGSKCSHLVVFHRAGTDIVSVIQVVIDKKQPISEASPSESKPSEEIK